MFLCCLYDLVMANPSCFRLLPILSSAFSQTIALWLFPNVAVICLDLTSYCYWKLKLSKPPKQSNTHKQPHLVTFNQSTALGNRHSQKEAVSQTHSPESHRTTLAGRTGVKQDREDLV
ncbi:hypothetical protein RRG08_048886 [Elysia crispata]|uniref:Uncharacterized protein n=1 Tax=Elysia crispata TaxID=231223 RepID=A0AAE1D4T5_9GAST|nr:hypothetical protein RRG08_048886 [Elysia crispata]